MSACPLCGSAKTSSVSKRDRLGRRVRTWLCEDCGLVFNAPCPSAKELIEAYLDEAGETIRASAEDLSRSVRILAKFERGMTEYWPILRGHRRLLDACVETGEFTFLLRELGFEVEALDPSPDCAAYCRQVLDLDVEVADVADKSYPPGAFDVIRVHHLLVHQRDLINLLGKLRSWLADDGLLYLETPNIEAEAALRAKGDIFDLGHTYYFNPVSLRAVLGHAGFTEAEETRQRHADTTAGFFRKGPIQPLEPDPDNALRVSNAITRNYSGRPLQALGRVVSDLAAKAIERKPAVQVTDQRAAADYYAARLKAKLIR
jgi:SAM-dependent methyltransferase